MSLHVISKNVSFFGWVHGLVVRALTHKFKDCIVHIPSTHAENLAGK